MAARLGSQYDSEVRALLAQQEVPGGVVAVNHPFLPTAGSTRLREGRVRTVLVTDGGTGLGDLGDGGSGSGVVDLQAGIARVL